VLRLSLDACISATSQHPPVAILLLLTAQQGLDPGQLPAAPSIKLPNILPEQRQECSTSDSSRPAAAQPSLPEALRQQQAHAAELWQALDAHMQGFSQLAELSASLLGCDAHPHAIDATQLRAAGQLWGAPPAAGLDVAALVEAWLYDVGSVCRYVKTLAGQCADVGQQQAHQARGWLPVRAPGSSSSGGGGGGIGRSCFMTPLVATGDASSHATHLYAQLQLHSASRDGLLALRSTLGQQLEDTGAWRHGVCSVGACCCSLTLATFASTLNRPAALRVAPLHSRSSGPAAGQAAARDCGAVKAGGAAGRGGSSSRRSSSAA
jgi:hypothetical protein